MVVFSPLEGGERRGSFRVSVKERLPGWDWYNEGRGEGDRGGEKGEDGRAGSRCKVGLRI